MTACLIAPPRQIPRLGLDPERNSYSSMGQYVLAAFLAAFVINIERYSDWNCLEPGKKPSSKASPSSGYADRTCHSTVYI